MYMFVRSPLAIVVSGIVSIAVAAFIYFVIVKPETDKARDATNNAIQQFQPNIDRAQRQAQPGIDRAQRIQNCIAKANGDPQKLARCQ